MTESVKKPYVLFVDDERSKKSFYDTIEIAKRAYGGRFIINTAPNLRVVEQILERGDQIDILVADLLFSRKEPLPPLFRESEKTLNRNHYSLPQGFFLLHWFASHREHTRRFVMTKTPAIAKTSPQIITWEASFDKEDFFASEGASVFDHLEE